MRLDVEHLPLAVDLGVGLKLRSGLGLDDAMLVAACKKMLHYDPVDAGFLQLRSDRYEKEIKSIILLK